MPVCALVAPQISTSLYCWHREELGLSCTVHGSLFLILTGDLRLPCACVSNLPYPWSPVYVFVATSLPVTGSHKSASSNELVINVTFGCVADLEINPALFKASRQNCATVSFFFFLSNAQKRLQTWIEFTLQSVSFVSGWHHKGVSMCGGGWFQGTCSTCWESPVTKKLLHLTWLF